MHGLTVSRQRLSGSRRAALITAATFVATCAVVVLLAVWSRQPWPSALASVLILAPGLYLAWKAVPPPGPDACVRTVAVVPNGNAVAGNLEQPDTFPIAVAYLALPVSTVPPSCALTLRAPQADTFRVYGTDEINALARTWALANRYLLCDGISHCAHGLYLMDDCPGECSSIADLDHVTVWMPAEFDEQDERRAFMLYQPYQTRLRHSAHAYGRAHGLRVEVNRPGDAWYGHSTLAVRMTIPGDATLWPVEREGLKLMGRARHEWGVR